jgi:hypothetical protein
MSFADRTIVRPYGLWRSEEGVKTWQPLEAVSSQASCGFAYQFVIPHALMEELVGPNLDSRTSDT